MCNFGKGCYEEQFCEIIFSFGQRFRRCHLKDFLPGALVALLFGGVEPFVQFQRGHHGEHSCEVIRNLDQWFRRCCLKKKITDDIQKLITIAHLEP